MRALILTACLLLAAAPAGAQQMVESGEYVVHYNALPTTTLTPEVARSFSITRSPNRALLNISVQRKIAEDTNQSIRAKVQGSASNLVGQRRELSVREVRDGDAIYYLSEVGVSDRETLNFDVEVLPEGAEVRIPVRFQQSFVPAAQ